MAGIRLILSNFFLSLIFLLNSLAISAKDIYVSPDGSDENPGTKKLPLKSIVFAKEKAEQLLHNGLESEVTVWMNNGIYYIMEPLVFTEFSEKNQNASLSFKAEKNAYPVLSGGIELTGWQKNEKGLWEANLAAQIDNMQIRELYINDMRCTRARFPNHDYLRVNKVGEDRRTNFYFIENDFPIPENIKDVELVLLHDWSISRIGIREIDRDGNRLTAIDSIGAKSPDFFNLDHWEKNPRYFLENAPEFIDTYYEWVYISTEKKIILKLPENENPSELKIIIPASEGLVQIRGKEHAPIKNIHFEGIAFRHSKWNIPQKGYCGVQACHYDPRPEKVGWNVVPAAISIEWAENSTFSNCNFENLGGSGLWLGTGCKNCTIKNSVFSDISGNGIMIGEGQDREVEGNRWWKSAPEQVTLGNTVENCSVTKCGQQFYGAVGIWCGLVAETIIKNCQVFDLPYTGISIGWMWSPEQTPCRQNLIEGCHIHDIMQILSDGGGIYSLGLQPGSKILNNHIHDVKINAGRAESNGMFLDEGTTDVIVAGNLIYNIAKSPLRFHRATTNLVKENYLFCTNENPPIRYNTTKEEDIRKIDNMVFLEKDKNYRIEMEKAIRNWKNK